MRYNYKDIEETQETIFCNTHGLLTDLIETFETLRRYEFISIYSNHKNILNVLKWMIVEGIIKSDCEDLLQNKFHEDENVILTLNYNKELHIEKMYINNLCKNSDAALTYLHDTVCNSDVLLTLENKLENILCYCFESEINERDSYN